MYLVGREHDIAILRETYRKAKSAHRRNLVTERAQAFRNEGKNKRVAHLRFQLIQAEIARDHAKSERIRYAIQHNV